MPFIQCNGRQNGPFTIRVPFYALERDPTRQAVAMRTGGFSAAFPARPRTCDAETVSLETQHVIEQLDKPVARPQLLRTRSLLLMDRGEFGAAIEALSAGAEIARSQHAVVEVARTMVAMREAARKHGDAGLRVCILHAPAALADLNTGRSRWYDVIRSRWQRWAAWPGRQL